MATVPVAFATDFEVDKLVLLQIPNDEIEGLLTNPASSKTMCFKASQEKAEVVFCTPTKTYSVRKVETSNTILLSEMTTSCGNVAADAPQKKRTKTVAKDAAASAAPQLIAKSSATFHYEIKRIKPKLQQLRALLLKWPYRGKARESDSHDVETRFTELEDQVQASAREIQSGLASLFALEINGCWRVVDDKVLREHFTAMLAVIEVNDWSLDAVPAQECIRQMGDENEALISRHCVKVFGVPGQPEDKDKGTVKLCHKKIGVFCATQILLDHPTQHTWQTSDFMVAWETKMPSGCIPARNWLVQEGVMLVTDRLMRRFPTDISEDPETMLQKLFAFHPRFSQDQLRPFLRQLVGPGLDEQELLRIHTRRTTSASGVVAFSKR